ncbi:unnamed protein product [Amoebophrya sp. A120]|nr:unnamed protein product [Amoebophrya sp. A120]|eukprot:GSA120T00024743001.1
MILEKVLHTTTTLFQSTAISSRSLAEENKTFDAKFLRMLQREIKRLTDYVEIAGQHLSRYNCGPGQDEENIKDTRTIIAGPSRSCTSVEVDPEEENLLAMIGEPLLLQQKAIVTRSSCTAPSTPTKEQTGAGSGESKDASCTTADSKNKERISILTPRTDLSSGTTRSDFLDAGQEQRQGEETKTSSPKLMSGGQQERKDAIFEYFRFLQRKLLEEDDNSDIKEKDVGEQLQGRARKNAKNLIFHSDRLCERLSNLTPRGWAQFFDIPGLQVGGGAATAGLGTAAATPRTDESSTYAGSLYYGSSSLSSYRNNYSGTPGAAATAADEAGRTFGGTRTGGAAAATGALSCSQEDEMRMLQGVFSKGFLQACGNHLKLFCDSGSLGSPEDGDESTTSVDEEDDTSSSTENEDAQRAGGKLLHQIPRSPRRSRLHQKGLRTSRRKSKRPLISPRLLDHYRMVDLKFTTTTSSSSGGPRQNPPEEQERLCSLISYRHFTDLMDRDLVVEAGPGTTKSRAADADGDEGEEPEKCVGRRNREMDEAVSVSPALLHLPSNLTQDFRGCDFLFQPLLAGTGTENLNYVHRLQRILQQGARTSGTSTASTTSSLDHSSSGNKTGAAKKATTRAVPRRGGGGQFIRDTEEHFHLDDVRSERQDRQCDTSTSLDTIGAARDQQELLQFAFLKWFCNADLRHLLTSLKFKKKHLTLQKHVVDQLERDLHTSSNKNDHANTYNEQMFTAGGVAGGLFDFATSMMFGGAEASVPAEDAASLAGPPRGVNNNVQEQPASSSKDCSSSSASSSLVNQEPPTSSGSELEDASPPPPTLPVRSLEELEQHGLFPPQQNMLSSAHDHATVAMDVDLNLPLFSDESPRAGRARNVDDTTFGEELFFQPSTRTRQAQIEDMIGTSTLIGKNTNNSTATGASKKTTTTTNAATRTRLATSLFDDFDDEDVTEANHADHHHLLYSSGSGPPLPGATKTSVVKKDFLADNSEILWREFGLRAQDYQRSGGLVSTSSEGTAGACNAIPILKSVDEIIAEAEEEEELLMTSSSADDMTMGTSGNIVPLGFTKLQTTRSSPLLWENRFFRPWVHKFLADGEHVALKIEKYNGKYAHLSKSTSTNLAPGRSAATSSGDAILNNCGSSPPVVKKRDLPLLLQAFLLLFNDDVLLPGGAGAPSVVGEAGAANSFTLLLLRVIRVAPSEVLPHLYLLVFLLRCIPVEFLAEEPPLIDNFSGGGAAMTARGGPASNWKFLAALKQQAVLSAVFQRLELVLKFAVSADHFQNVADGDEEEESESTSACMKKMNVTTTFSRFQHCLPTLLALAYDGFFLSTAQAGRRESCTTTSTAAVVLAKEQQRLVKEEWKTLLQKNKPGTSITHNRHYSFGTSDHDLGFQDPLLLLKLAPNAFFANSAGSEVDKNSVDRTPGAASFLAPEEKIVQTNYSSSITFVKEESSSANLQSDWVGMSDQQTETSTVQVVTQEQATPGGTAGAVPTIMGSGINGGGGGGSASDQGRFSTWDEKVVDLHTNPDLVKFRTPGVLVTEIVLWKLYQLDAMEQSAKRKGMKSELANKEAARSPLDDSQGSMTTATMLPTNQNTSSLIRDAIIWLNLLPKSEKIARAGLSFALFEQVWMQDVASWVQMVVLDKTNSTSSSKTTTATEKNRRGMTIKGNNYTNRTTRQEFQMKKSNLQTAIALLSESLSVVDVVLPSPTTSNAGAAASSSTSATTASSSFASNLFSVEPSTCTSKSTSGRLFQQNVTVPTQQNLQGGPRGSPTTPIQQQQRLNANSSATSTSNRNEDMEQTTPMSTAKIKNRYQQHGGSMSSTPGRENKTNRHGKNYLSSSGKKPLPYGGKNIDAALFFEQDPQGGGSSDLAGVQAAHPDRDEQAGDHRDAFPPPHMNLEAGYCEFLGINSAQTSSCTTGEMNIKVEGVDQSGKAASPDVYFHTLMAQQLFYPPLRYLQEATMRQSLHRYILMSTSSSPGGSAQAEELMKVNNNVNFTGRDHDNENHDQDRKRSRWKRYARGSRSIASSSSLAAFDSSVFTPLVQQQTNHVASSAGAGSGADHNQQSQAVLSNGLLCPFVLNLQKNVSQVNQISFLYLLKLHAKIFAAQHSLELLKRGLKVVLLLVEHQMTVDADLVHHSDVEALEVTPSPSPTNAELILGLRQTASRTRNREEAGRAVSSPALSVRDLLLFPAENRSQDYNLQHVNMMKEEQEERRLSFLMDRLITSSTTISIQQAQVSLNLGLQIAEEWGVSTPFQKRCLEYYLQNLLDDDLEEFVKHPMVKQKLLSGDEQHLHLTAFIEQQLSDSLDQRIALALTLLCRDSAEKHAMVLCLLPKQTLDRYLTRKSSFKNFGQDTVAPNKAYETAMLVLSKASSLLEHPAFSSRNLKSPGLENSPSLRECRFILRKLRSGQL